MLRRNPRPGDQVLDPIKAYGAPLLIGLPPAPFNALRGAVDALYPAGLQWYWKADFFTEISDEAIDIHVKHGGSPGLR